MATNTTNYNLVKPAGNDAVSIDVINANMDIIDSVLKANADGISTKANKSTIVDTTLIATTWSSNSYDLVVSGVTATSVQEILPALSITDSQLEALQGANLVDGGQDIDTITLIARGDVPTVNIPIRVILRGDM